MGEQLETSSAHAYIDTELRNMAHYADQRLYLLDDLRELHQRYSVLLKFARDLTPTQTASVNKILERLTFEIAARRHEGRAMTRAVENLLSHGETDVISQLRP